MYDKQLKFLCRFLIWLLILLLIIFVGISNIFALETKTIYPNNNFTQNANNYLSFDANGSIGITNVNLTISGQSYGFAFSFPETISTNKTYTLIINFMSDDLLKTFQNSYVHIESCASSSGSILCVDNNIISVVKNNNNANSNKLTIQFTSSINGSYFNISLLSDGPPYQVLTGINNYGIKSVQLDSTSDTNDIINNQNQNANNIINNQNSNTQEIINNQNNSSSAIINNQNQNTQQQIESQKVCNSYDASNIIIDGKYFSSSGSQASSLNWGITDFIDINNANVTIAPYDSGTQAYSCFYNINKSLLSCKNNLSISSSDIPTNAYYMRLSISKVRNLPTANVCKNGNQALSDDLNDLNNSLTDSSPVDMSSLGDVAGWLPAGPIDSIINLPLTFMNNLYTALSSSCSSLHVPIPYLTNKFIDIPCISTIYAQINGFDTFWNWVGAISSVLILYKYLIALYKYYDDLTTLKANFISDFGGAP